MQSTGKTTLEGIEILIAEDEESNFLYLKAILEAEKAIIIRAYDGYEVLNIIKENPSIPLILMDLKMPNMSGFEASKIVKSKYPNIMIIAQTAYVLAGDREKALKAGCDEYIGKPLRKDEMLALIQKILFD